LTITPVGLLTSREQILAIINEKRRNQAATRRGKHGRLPDGLQRGEMYYSDSHCLISLKNNIFCLREYLMIIAQLSDIHAAPGNDNLARFDRALAWLDQIDLNALVISGDLIDDNGLEGYEQIARRLTSRPWPTWVLPGNSDDKDQMRRQSGERFVAANASTSACHFVAHTGSLRLIGLDTTLPGESAGAVGPHLAWLDETLSAEPSTPSILFLHHHIIKSGIPTMDNIMCRDDAELAALLGEHPARPLALSSGHVHRPVMGVFAGIPAYICGSICPANPLWLGTDNVPAVFDPPALMIHRFHQGTLISHHVSVG
jgi:Icc protein